MIFIVCGGRTFADDDAVCTALDRLHVQETCTLVLIGGATGADAAAAYWAQTRGVDRIIVPANWERDGKAGGPRRNVRMLRLARLLADTRNEYYCVIAFPGGKGTDHMCRTAQTAGVKVVQPMADPMTLQAN